MTVGASASLKCGVSRAFRPVSLIVVIAMIVTACSGPRSDDRTTAGIPPTGTVARPLATPATSPSASPRAQTSATAGPSPSPSQPTPTTPATPAPLERPAGQRVDLPDVDAHYNLDITTLDLTSGVVQVEQHVEVRSREQRPTALMFSIAAATFGYFSLDETRVDGAVVSPERRHDGFTLAVPLPDADHWTIEFAFHLNLKQVPQDWYGTGLDGTITRLGYWFPIISTDYPYPSTADPAYSRVASFDVWLPLPPDTPFVATGTEVARERMSDGRVLHHLKGERVRDFAIIVAPGFRLDTRMTRSNVSVELLSPASMASAKRTEALDAAVLTIDRLTDLIGPYPYPVFRMAHAGSSLPGGIEFPMLVMLNMDVGRLDRLVYHETAHQWFYGLIGTRPQQDPWIDEGGAQFLEGGIASGFSTSTAPPAGGYRFPLDSSDAELPTGAGIPGFEAIYLQGQAFYQTVLRTMGEEPFWDALRELYQSNRYEIVVPWELLSLWQKHSQVDLRPLYRQTFRYAWIDDLPPPGVEP